MFTTGYTVHDLSNLRLRFVKSPQQAPGFEGPREHQIWRCSLLHVHVHMYECGVRTGTGGAKSGI